MTSTPKKTVQWLTTKVPGAINELVVDPIQDLIQDVAKAALSPLSKFLTAKASRSRGACYIDCGLFLL